MQKPSAEGLLSSGRQRAASEGPSRRDPGVKAGCSGSSPSLRSTVSFVDEASLLLPEGTKPASGGIRGLWNQLGWQMLVFLMCSQHVTKGLVNDLLRAAQRYVFREYRVPAPRMAMFDGVVALPWALKPILGVLADTCPIGGYSKMPYIMIAALMGMYSMLCLGQMQHELSLAGVVALLFICSMYASTVDLLSEAVLARELRARPGSGPSLVSFVWGGVDMMGMVAAVVAGLMLVYFTPWAMFTFAAVPASFVMGPALLNWMREPCLSREEACAQRSAVWAQREAVVLALVMLASTLLLTSTGMWLTVRQNALVTLGVLVVIVSSFSLMLNPVIAKVNAFGLLQAALQLSLSSASFYFMLDGEDEYPDGPHFSVTFYSMVLPVCGNAFSVLGIWLYNRYVSTWTYQKMYVVGNLVGVVANVLDVFFYLRMNKMAGIPDTVFVLGSSGLQDTMREWLWMPGVVLISHMCPKGMEAIMFANLAGCHNLGYTASVNLGAWMLEALEIQPAGVAGERHQFDNLWAASMISTLLPLVLIGFVPWFIPDKLSTEPIFEDPDAISATDGSLLRRFMGWGSPPPRAATQEPAGEPEPAGA